MRFAYAGIDFMSDVLDALLREGWTLVKLFTRPCDGVYDTNEAVTSMEQTTSEVVAGARLAEDAGLALGEIEKVSNDLSDLIQNISSAARQQSAAATNISATMNVIQEITTQTSVGASQTAESIGNLAQLAADLRRSVADFKLPA